MTNAPTSARQRIADAEVPGWTGGVMLGLRWVTLLVEVSAMLLLGTLAGGVLLGLGPALRAGSVITARMTQEAHPWRTFWHTWRTDFWATNATFAPFWVLAVLLWFDGIAVTMLGYPAAPILLGALIAVLLWSAVMLTYWPRLAVHRQPFTDTWRLLLFAPLLGPGTALATGSVLAAAVLVGLYLPVVGVLAAVPLVLWSTGRLVQDRLDRLTAPPAGPAQPGSGI